MEDEEIDIVFLCFVLKKSVGLGGLVKIVKEVLCYLVYVLQWQLVGLVYFRNRCKMLNEREFGVREVKIQQCYNFLVCFEECLVLLSKW